MNFGAGVAHETAFSIALNNKVTPDKVAANRAAVQARGRGQF
jgi:enoyl-CoA hydratase